MTACAIPAPALDDNRTMWLAVMRVLHVESQLYLPLYQNQSTYLKDALPVPAFPPILL